MTRCRRNVLAGFGLLIGFWGCSEARSAAPLASQAPLGVPAPPVSRNVVHEGIVYEFVRTGPPRPIPNLRLLSICSPVGADFPRTVTARQNGYRPATRGIVWGWDFTVNLTLERN